MYKKRSTMFVSEINDDKCYVNVYQDFELQETFVGDTPDDVWKNLGYIQNIQNFQENNYLDWKIGLHCKYYQSYTFCNILLMNGEILN